jgi:hypothetical protein
MQKRFSEEQIIGILAEAVNLAGSWIKIDYLKDTTNKQRTLENVMKKLTERPGLALLVKACSQL